MEILYLRSEGWIKKISSGRAEAWGKLGDGSSRQMILRDAEYPEGEDIASGEGGYSFFSKTGGRGRPHKKRSIAVEVRHDAR